MKKITVIVLSALFSVALFSCNPESITDEIAPQACCGEGSEVPPPPPPPPPTGEGG